MIRSCPGIVRVLAFCGLISAGLTAADELQLALDKPILDPDQARSQYDLYLLARIPQLQMPDTAQAWQREASRIRKRVLAEVVFRGVPRDWYSGKPEVVWEDEITTNKGYTIRKLRYEALPGLWIPALLYTPRPLSNKVPAILNVNGHAATGKSTAYKQLRCINQAKRGMLALNVEWIGMGQLRGAGYAHNHLAMLDLCGRSGLSVFYLAMSRGLDVLQEHPHADADRLAVTGLSGGGWQTIILSSLDTRVKLAVPVAGYSALRQRVEHQDSIGDLEQNPTDLLAIADYVHLTAMLTPRPALLIYNAKDDCCFVAKTVKPNTYDPVIPFYRQAGAAEAFEYYENVDPGTHNFELDNRQQLYRFVNRHFCPREETSFKEIASEDEVQDAKALDVALPEDNATFFSLAADAARELPRPTPDRSLAEPRERLKNILRFKTLSCTAEEVGAPESIEGKTIARYRMQVGPEWVVPAMVVRGEQVKNTTVLLADAGAASQSARIEALVTSGTQVLCIDPVLFGQANPGRHLAQDAMLLSTLGERPLGIQTAQVLAVIERFAAMAATGKIHVHTVGPRAGLIGLCAAALDAGTRIGQVRTEDMPDSLKAFLEPTASYDQTPEVYCFGLLEWFDRPQLERLAQP